jgi:hypothetical protein
VTEQTPQAEQPAPVWAAPETDVSETGAPADRPEVAVGAAFAGGLLAALILKRLVR